MIAKAWLVLIVAALSVHAADVRQGASFKEGNGVTLSDETRRAIGLEVVDVEDRPFSAGVKVAAQVYREASEKSQNSGESAGFAYASALLDGDTAETMSPGSPVLVEGRTPATGQVLRLDRTMADNGGRVEVLIQINDPTHVWKLGDFARVSLSGAKSREATVVPQSAVLHTAYGDFVFVLNGSAYLRTPVKTGARHGESIEVLDGLYSGDQIAARSVETLYLIELRATKGGGHSH